jgi:hypothetical protein
MTYRVVTYRRNRALMAEKDEERSRAPNVETDLRRLYLAEYHDLVTPHIERAFVYEKHAIEAALSGFRALSYMNAGGLVAIPTAVALFNADPKQASKLLVTAGLWFIAGLIAVLWSQGCLFFTMARRSEAEHTVGSYQANRLNAALLAYANDTEKKKLLDDANKLEVASQKNRRRSDIWRALGILFFWTSLACFISGCWFGARAVLS